jgi:hypothetical protein
MSSSGKVRVMVRTRKVPVGTTVVTKPMFTPSGVFLGLGASRVVLFESMLDDADRTAIKEGRRLSRRLGLDLEVVDASRSNPFRRLLSLVRRGDSPEPDFLVAPQAGEHRGSHGLL